jgi:hypothetical protein
LNVINGQLGVGASWRWYTGSCGGTLAGTGLSLTVSPAVTTTYFLRAEGTCNNTACLPITVVVLDTSVPAVSINGTTTICRGKSTTLTPNGGSLGTGASWKWYSGSCGGTLVATGNSFVASPSNTTTYFLRAENSCNTTICRSITITVQDTSAPATSVIGQPAICLGETTTLSVNGGSLGAGANWKWYSGTCGGLAVGTGSNLTLTPTIPGFYTYFVRAEGTCNNTVCARFVLNVRDTSTPATTIVAGSTSICRGKSTTLTVGNGILGTGATWKWYAGSCGSNIVGTGGSISVSPTATTTYFVRAEGPCGNTICTSITIEVSTPPADANQIIASSDEVCAGSYVKMYVTGPALRTGESRKWYLVKGAALTPIGSGDTISITSSSTMDVLVRTESNCFNSAGIIKRINVLNYPAGTWIGLKSTDWHDSLNWCSGLPTSSTDVTIPSGTRFKPVITKTAFTRSLTINSGADVTINAGGTLELNGSFVKNGTFTSNGTVVFAGSSNTSVDGFVTKNLKVNTGASVSINADVKVTGTLVMVKGKVKTSVNQIHVTNRNASAVLADVTNPNFTNGWVDGRVRREIQTIDSIYHFPVGSATNSNNLEFFNHNITGTSSIQARFGSKPGTDAGLNVMEKGTMYAKIQDGGVWYLEPNDTVANGNFDLRLWFHSQPAFTTGLVDNGFSILNRPSSSILASEWKTPPVNSNYVVGVVSNGYAERTSVKGYGQYGIGQTMYPVGTKTIASNGMVNINPNPYHDKFSVSMNLPTAMNVKINIYDQAGRLVKLINAGTQAGNAAIDVQAADLSEGTYTVVISGNGVNLNTTKLVRINH